MTLPIGRQIAEAEHWQRQVQTEAAKPGKGQELARYRHEAAQAIVATLKWCRDNSEGIRAYCAAHKQEGGQG